MKALRPLGPALSAGALNRIIRGIIDAGPAGPSNRERELTTSLVWGEVGDDAGSTVSGRLRLPEAYTVTALTSLAAVKHVIDGRAPAGYQTPSTAFGQDFVLEIEGVELQMESDPPA